MLRARNLNCATLTFVSLSTFAASPTVFNGTWKADLDKNRRAEPPDLIELTNGIYRCKSCKPPYEVKADGQDHAVQGSSFYDTLSFSVVDDHSVVKIAKKAGSIVAEAKATVAPDGKSETVQQAIHPPGGQVFTLTQLFARVAAGPPGAHAISGSWEQTSTEGSDNVDVMTYKVKGDTLTMTNKTGQSYVAKLDGTDAPYLGNPGMSSVSVRQIDDRTIEETDKKEGTTVMVGRIWVDPDGVTMHARFDNQHGAVMQQTGHKVN